jgi:hypothetical protein
MRIVLMTTRNTPSLVTTRLFLSPKPSVAILTLDAQAESATYNANLTGEKPFSVIALHDE